MNVTLGRGRTALTGPLIDGSGVRQSFIAVADNLASVSILLSTYCRKNRGRIIVDVVDASGKAVVSDSVDAMELIDNKYHRFKLPAELIIGRRYELKLRTRHCRAAMSPTAHYSLTTQQGYMFIGAKMVRDRELVCRFSYDAVEEKGKAALRKSPVPIETSFSGNVSGLISVVVPHYNCVEWLSRCLASLIYQTYSALQVIVIDDGSEDFDTVRLLVEHYRRFMSGIEFVSLGENRGAPHARNVGAQRAHGEYLFFADADCEFYPKTLETMLVALMDDETVGFAYGGFQWGCEFVKPREFDAEILRQKNYISTMSLMRKDLFPGFDESLNRHQDWDLWLTIVKNGGIGICVGDVLFETPRRIGSISTTENVPLKESIEKIRKKHQL